MKIRLHSFALIVAVAVPLLSDAQAIRAPGRVESGLVKAGDATIEYFSQGQGQVVVLLPGGPFAVCYMDGLAQALADSGYRVVRINFRGAGKSTGPDKGVTLHTLAADVASVIVALKLGPANVAGHAFGNRVARMLDADRPDLVRSLILFAAGGKVPPRPPVQDALRVIFNEAASEAEFQDAQKYMVGNPSEIEMVTKIMEPCRAPKEAAIQSAATQATPLEDWWAPPGSAKILVVQGTNDQAAPPANGELLKQELGARVTLVSFPGAGHLMVVTEPKKAADAVASFLH